jgi:hypothetical protein
LRVVGGRAAETAYFVGHSLKWEWMLSLCCGCGGGKTKTAPFFKEPFWFYVFAELCAVDDEFIITSF